MVSNKKLTNVKTNIQTNVCMFGAKTGSSAGPQTTELGSGGWGSTGGGIDRQPAVCVCVCVCVCVHARTYISVHSVAVSE